MYVMLIHIVIGWQGRKCVLQIIVSTHYWWHKKWQKICNCIVLFWVYFQRLDKYLAFHSCKSHHFFPSNFKIKYSFIKESGLFTLIEVILELWPLGIKISNKKACKIFPMFHFLSDSWMDLDIFYGQEKWLLTQRHMKL